MATLYSIRYGVAYSQEALNDITDNFSQVVGRAPSADDISNSEASLYSGTSLLALRVNLSVSLETYNALNGIWNDLIAANIDPTNYVNFVGYLQQPGTSLANVRSDLAYQPAAYNAINTLWIADTGNPVGPSDLAYWQNAFANGATQATLRNALSAYQPTLNAINTVYNNILGVNVDPASQSYWEGQFANGSNLATVRSTLANSSAADADVSQLYTTLTGSPIDSGSQANYQALLASGGNINSTAQAEVASAGSYAVLTNEIASAESTEFNTSDAAAYQQALLTTAETAPLSWSSVVQAITSEAISFIQGLNPISSAEAASLHTTITRAQAETYLQNPQVIAGLAMIQDAEGGQANQTYGHVTIANQNSFPLGYGVNTASGLYAITASSWGDYGRFLDGTTSTNFRNSADFSAHTQQLVAIEMMSYNGVLQPLLAGNINQAISAAAGSNGQLWAALPGGVQSRVTLDHAISVFTSNGGTVSNQ